MTIFLVATPIGNRQDLSFRAKEVLQSSDLLLCEDTRVTKKLLQAFAINKPLLSFHQHSSQKKFEEILSFLKTGKTIALVTDAGTPGISDPGGQLVNYLVKACPQIKIVPIPGPCAAIAALSVSGFPTDNFVFLGFPPQKKGREKFFEHFHFFPFSIVFYESCHRIEKTLSALSDLFPKRPLVVCRELTKMHESIYRGLPAQVTAQVKADSIKGEFVLVLGPEKFKTV